jgi:probable phosphoglycerate mutase
MKLFLVRHGNTDSLNQGTFQPLDTPLNSEGVRQAKALAKRLKDERFDLVITSSLARARQTTEIIGKEFEESELFVERTRPSAIIGKSKSDPEMKKIWEKTEEMYVKDQTWRFADEENFEDLKLRGEKALEFLINKNKEKILVITHGAFIGILVGLMMNGKDYDGKMFVKLDNFLRMDNTGISIFEYNPENGWRLESWNDRSHYLE